MGKCEMFYIVRIVADRYRPVWGSCTGEEGSYQQARACSFFENNDWGIASRNVKWAEMKCVHWRYQSKSVRIPVASASSNRY